MEFKFDLLKESDVEVKIKTCTANGAVALLYKTARVDMAALDKTVGAMNWACDYKEIKGNLYCGIGVRQSPQEEFVWKWDCGTESRADEEANQKKGEASDAFKRAGFKWGIGRELYGAPFIFLNIETKPFTDSRGKARYELSQKFARFDCDKIEYDDNGNITRVVITQDGKAIFDNGKNKKTASKPFPEQATPSADQIAILKKKRGDEVRDLLKIYKTVNPAAVAKAITEDYRAKNIVDLNENQYAELLIRIKENKL